MIREVIRLARQYQSPEAMCPFYNMEETNAIHCQGVEPGQTLILQSKGSSARYRKSRCYGDWTRCPIARMLWSLHDDPAYLRLMKNETGNKSGLAGLAIREYRQWEKENRP